MRPRFTVRGLMGLVLVVGLACSVVSGLRWNRRMSGCGPTCGSNISQIGLALRQYHEVNDCFPPAYVTDDVGNKLYSWRVLILPYLDYGDIYDHYNLCQAWNGPDNIRLSNTRLRTFCCPYSWDYSAAPNATNYVAVTGPGTLFPGACSSTIHDVRDRTSTLLVAEVAGPPIGWAEPRGLDVSTMSFAVNDPTRPSLSSRDDAGPAVAFVDGKVRRLGRSVLPATVKAITTIAGGEAVEARALDLR